jgi:diacylglycerol kinase family enzyme
VSLGFTIPPAPAGAYARPAMRVLVLLNPKSGTLASSTNGDEPQRVRRGLEARGLEVDVRMVDGGGGKNVDELTAAARAGAYDAVIAGGGDGTLNTIANRLAGGTVPFGVLPLGTHNHFAKDQDVPLDLDDAVAALADAVAERRFADLDVGEVNGRIFLNASAIGLHPEFVKERDAHYEVVGRFRVLRWILRRGLKLVTGVFAFFRKLDSLPILQVRLDFDGRRLRRVTPSVNVCCNVYVMRVLGLEAISCPTRERLNVYVARATGTPGVVRLLLKGLFRRLHSTNVRELESHCLPALRIVVRRRRLPVSVDGEVVEMRTPLQYRVRHGGLKVLAPRRNAE